MYNIQINNNIQLNQFSNYLNLKVVEYENFDSEMMTYGISIINKAFNLMNDYNQIAKYVNESFNSKYQRKTKWNCFIIKGKLYSDFYSDKFIIYSTNDVQILIFLSYH